MCVIWVCLFLLHSSLLQKLVPWNMALQFFFVILTLTNNNTAPVWLEAGWTAAPRSECRAAAAGSGVAASWAGKEECPAWGGAVSQGNAAQCWAQEPQEGVEWCWGPAPHSAKGDPYAQRQAGEDTARKVCSWVDGLDYVLLCLVFLCSLRIIFILMFSSCDELIR